MGCNTSRLDCLPAVTLCRDRCKFLDEALCHSYALADAHVTHMESLKTLGSALFTFFHQFEEEEEEHSSVASSSSPTSPLRSDSITILHSESATTEEDENTKSQFFNPIRYDSSPPPPPPPPPSTSAWDFLNVFETFEKYQHQVVYTYSPTRDTDVKFKEMKKKTKEAASKEHNSVSHKKLSESSANVISSPNAFLETMKEIEILFARASDSGIPILEMLDVGKLRYHQNIAVNPVPCKIMHVFPPSKPLTDDCMESLSLSRRMGSEFQAVGIEEGKDLTCGNLCYTLKKLCMWEKKLYDEVKAEEKLRMLHDKKCKQLRQMIKKGADAQKVDAVETFIRILATKIKMSFQVVDKISNTICELRDEELWPQINSFIFGFLRMWKDMVECYRCQHHKIAEAESLDSSSFNRKLSNSNLDAAIKLKYEIQNWNLSFSNWIYALKSQVKALNGWLVRCLVHEPPEEEIPDDGKTPPLFVICTKWSRAMDNLSEKDVIEAVDGFILRVNELLEKHISELQQKLTLDKELEKKVRILEKQEQKMHKVVHARERKMGAITTTDTLLTGNAAVHHGEVDPISLKSGLKHIFAAMERFTASFASEYEELCKQIEQDNKVEGELKTLH